MYITVCKIGNSGGSVYDYDAGNPKAVLSDNLEGWHGREVGGGFKRAWTYVYPMLIHINIWQKPSQYCKVIIL